MILPGVNVAAILLRGRRLALRRNENRNAVHDCVAVAAVRAEQQGLTGGQGEFAVACGAGQQITNGGELLGEVGGG